MASPTSLNAELAANLSGLEFSERCAIVIHEQRVPLSPEGLERAQNDKGEVGKKLVEAVRVEVDRATDG
jgi:hypothetical protein